MTLKIDFIRIPYDDTPQSDIDEMIMLYQQEAQELNPLDPPKDVSLTLGRMMGLQHSANFDHHLYLIRTEDGKPVAKFQLMLARPGSNDYETRHIYAPLLMYVVPEMRQQGIAKQILRYVLTTYANHNLEYIDGYTTFDNGVKFAEHIGAKLAFEEVEKWVNYADLDWDMIQAWHEAGQSRNPETRIIRFDGLYSDDDVELQKFCNLATAIEETMDHGDTAADPTTVTIDEVRKTLKLEQTMGILPTYMITIEPDGHLSGLTKIKSYQNDLAHIRQGTTGVHPTDRGRGLGKWLKAEMLLHIKHRYPTTQVISTSNANVNPPMNSINERIGFKLHYRRKFYKISVADLKTYLGIH